MTMTITAPAIGSTLTLNGRHYEVTSVDAVPAQGRAYQLGHRFWLGLSAGGKSRKATNVTAFADGTFSKIVTL